MTSMAWLCIKTWSKLRPWQKGTVVSWPSYRRWWKPLFDSFQIPLILFLFKKGPPRLQLPFGRETLSHLLPSKIVFPQICSSQITQLAMWNDPPGMWNAKLPNRSATSRPRRSIVDLVPAGRAGQRGNAQKRPGRERKHPCRNPIMVMEP